MSAALGIDLGGTQIKGVLVSPDGEVLRREVRATGDDGGGARAWAETIRALADELGRDLPAGLSAPSPERCMSNDAVETTLFFA